MFAHGFKDDWRDVVRAETQRQAEMQVDFWSLTSDWRCGTTTGLVSIYVIAVMRKMMSSMRKKKSMGMKERMEMTSKVCGLLSPRTVWKNIASLHTTYTLSLSLTDESVRGMKRRILHCFRTSKGRCLNEYWLQRESCFSEPEVVVDLFDDVGQRPDDIDPWVYYWYLIPYSSWLRFFDETFLLDLWTLAPERLVFDLATMHLLIFDLPSRIVRSLLAKVAKRRKNK